MKRFRRGAFVSTKRAVLIHAGPPPQFQACRKICIFNSVVHINRGIETYSLRTKKKWIKVIASVMFTYFVQIHICIFGLVLRLSTTVKDKLVALGHRQLRQSNHAG